MSIALNRLDYDFKAIYLRVETDKGILLLRQFGVPEFHWVFGHSRIPTKLTTTIFEFGEEL